MNLNYSQPENTMNILFCQSHLLYSEWSELTKKQTEKK